MSVDADIVARVARLARIDVAPERRAALAGELNALFGWIDQLNEVDVDGVAPMASVFARQMPLREDAVTDGAMAGRILANAPKASDGFFVVPKVVE